MSPTPVLGFAHLMRRRSTAERKLKDIRGSAAAYRDLSDRQLKSVAEDVRQIQASSSGNDQQRVTACLALAAEALRRTLGVTLYDVQLQAAISLTSGHVAEMQTGEGKTLSAVPAAVYWALCGRPVHVVTPNHYLATRDFEQLRPAYDTLGIAVACLPEQAADNAKQSAYAADVIYGTGYELGFDYLRDQLKRCTNSHQPLGSNLLAQLQQSRLASDLAFQRRECAIVDEVDNVLIDDASSPLVLSDTPPGVAPDADVFELARKTVDCLIKDHHYRRISDTTVQLLPAGLNRIHGADIEIPTKLLRRPWSEYIQQALRASVCFYRDVHYVIRSDKLQIVDCSTGRIFSDRTWSDGLHQAIEAKERLLISNECQALAQVTRQRFFRLYPKLAGMTGTANGCEREFRGVFGMGTRRIPQRVPSKRVCEPMRAFATADAKWEAIARDVRRRRQAGRPILVGTRTISESQRLAALLEAKGIDYQLLNGVQDADEAAIVSQAGDSAVVTIATNLAGRGTDIRLSNRVHDRGGLHVIVSEPHDLARVDRQLVGRCARQGDPGSAQSFVSAEDSIVRHHGPWLTRPIIRCANLRGEVGMDLTFRIQSVQQAVARRQMSARMAMMRQDLARDSLLSRLGHTR